MSDVPRPVTGAEREARRELLREALEDLAASPDPHRGAHEVIQALDAYLDAHPSSQVAPREPPVTDFARRTAPAPRRARAISPALPVILGAAAVATVAVALLVSGGWPAGLAIVVIWVVALFALASAS